LKRAAEQEAAEFKKAEQGRVAERTRPRRVVRVVRCGTSTARTAMYLFRLAGDLENCHWAGPEHCSAALQEALAAGKRDGFAEQDTVSLPVEPLKQLRKSRRSRDSRRTDYLVRSQHAARMRAAANKKSLEEKLRQREANRIAQRKWRAGYFDGLLSDDDLSEDESQPAGPCLTSDAWMSPEDQDLSLLPLWRPELALQRPECSVVRKPCAASAQQATLTSANASSTTDS